MAFFKPRPVGDFLRRRKLILLKREADAQCALLERVRALLPPPQAPHCTAARLDEGELVLFADSPAWATRLRYAGPEILEGLEKTGSSASALRIRISPVAEPPVPPKRQARRLSAANAELLLQVADAIQDPALGAALRRLATRRR